MRVRLGINNCFAVKRWPGPLEWSEVVTGELGIGLVQHSLDLTDVLCAEADLEREARAIRDALDRCGVSLDSLFTGLAAYSHGLMLAPRPSERTRGREHWSRAVRLAGLLGVDCCGGHVGSLSRADADDAARRAARWSQLGEQLDELRREARPQGVTTLLVENMACDREPSSMAQLASLLRGADGDRAGIGLCLDVGHQCVPGSSGPERDPYAWLARLGREARVVHVQQSDAEADRHWPFTAEYNRLGRIRAPRVLDALAKSGTDEAVLILEVIPPFEAQDSVVLEQLRESVEHWRQALDEYGVDPLTQALP